MTEEEIDALQLSKLDKATPFAIGGVSQSQLSIARHYGGCKFQGRIYSYIPTTDELLRDDVVKWLTKHRKTQKKVGADGTAMQQELMIPNVESEGAARLYAQLPSTGGLGVAVPPAPTFGKADQ